MTRVNVRIQRTFKVNGVFILVEMLRGRPVPAEKEALVHVGGFAVLIGLMIAVSYHDVAAMFSGKPAF